MVERLSTNDNIAVRPINKLTKYYYKYQKYIITISLVLVVVSTSIAGYIWSNKSKEKQQPPLVAVESSTKEVNLTGLQSFNDALVRDEQLCESIEKINLQERLEQEQMKAEELSDALQSKEAEMTQLEDTILNALMSNLNTQLISRSSGTVSSYAEEAANLIDLQYKLELFKQTPEADEIDLTEYENTIKNKLDYLPTKKPCSGALRGYGTRIHPVYGHRHFHPAVDMTTSHGSPIYAAGAGTVTIAGYGSSQGNYIEINHGNGFTTVYMHCSKLNVSVGDCVTKGQQIANVGSTGTSTGPHLHFEIRLYGEPLNPAIMIMQ